MLSNGGSGGGGIEGDRISEGRCWEEMKVGEGSCDRDVSD